MKVYVAGPISLGGLLDAEAVEVNIARFSAASAILQRLGHEPLLPIVHRADSWQGYMRLGLVMMLSADAVVLLDGWEASVGARIERGLAYDLGMRVWTVPELIRAHAERVTL